MDELFWAFILLMIAAGAVALAMYAFVAFLIIAGIITAILLPGVIIGFVQALRRGRDGRR